ncbi:MAG TPA: MFS transporter [Phycisphaerae bacterium]|nr:MFS transporter [Phycisphaerae bacterium]HRR85370.1 MFS transporter [Phycisphaerae bacterium]
MSDAVTQSVSFLGRFTVLKGAARELWITFAIKLLGIIAYSVMNTTFVLWLSYDLGYSDEHAGYWVGAWSALMTLLTVLVGSLTDAIGLRKAFLLGVIVCVGARAVMTFTAIPWVALGAGLLPLALGEALGTPVLVAAIRRYSTTAQRSISFSIFYAMMNVGFLIASYIFDYVREGLGEHGRFTLPLVGIELTSYRTLFLISLIVEILMLPIVWLIREGVEATDEGVKITPGERKGPHENVLSALILMIRDTLRESARIFAGLWRQSGFYKFLAFLALAAFVRLIFIQMYYTYPKFGIRELGEGAAVGRLWAINPFLIIFLVPLVGAISQRISAYRMVSIGSAIAAASVFIMAMPPAWFQPLADGRLGHLIANTWLGGGSRFTPDDFLDLPSLTRRFASASDPASLAVSESFSEATRALLHRRVAVADRISRSTQHPSSALLIAADIADPDSFVARLQKDPEPATRPVSDYLWGRFPAAQRQKMTDANLPPTKRIAVLLEELNRVLKDESFCEKHRDVFRAIQLSEATRALLKLDPRGSEDVLSNLSVLQNRLLLEDAYPSHIAASDHPLRAALAHDLSRMIRKSTVHIRFADGRQLAATRPVLEDVFSVEIARNRVGVPGSVSPWYVMIFLFIVLLSLGESIYSPRLYEYAACIAPKGQEASYMALSYLPFFLAKLFVATFSGVLLARYCPEAGDRHSGTLWLIIALITTIAPVGLVTLRRWIRVPEAGRGD